MIEHTHRKLEHLEIALAQDVSSGLSTGLERVRLAHRALPEMALDDVSTSTSFLGTPLGAPILISAMTGGAKGAAQVNRNLAIAAAELGFAMGVGSQRAAIADPALMDSYQIRDVAPDILLFANLGAVQLNTGFGVRECVRAVEAIGANALVLHLNGLQEALQSNGNSNMRGLGDRIASVCGALPYPVIVKEVGWGMAPADVSMLLDAGVAAIDISGAGGTSWSEVESHRASSEDDAIVARAFRDWGWTTAESLATARDASKSTPLIASGGIRTGIDVFKCLALGADLVGLATPLLRAATVSSEEVLRSLVILLRQMRIAMFATGARDIASLNESRLVPVTG